MQWYSMDLHIHTPGSSDFKDRESIRYLDILRKLEAEHIDIMSFADHNTVAGFAAMQREMQDLERFDAMGRISPEEKKALDLTVLKLNRHNRICDYFLIASGSSARQVKAISDGIEEKAHKAGLRPFNTEGYEEATWVLLDYGDIVVHVFRQEARSFYGLERLWADSDKITF